MAKFLPVVKLYDPIIYRAIKDGQLKLQAGQYVSCCVSGSRPYSRFVGYDGTTFNIAHGHNPKAVNEKFSARIQVKRAIVARFGKL